MQEMAGIVYVTSEEMRRIDDITIREFQVDVLVLMENAGRATATMARRMLQGTTIGKRVACLVGGGNNGGEGKGRSRDLANLGGDGEGIVCTTKGRIEEVNPGQHYILGIIGS